MRAAGIVVALAVVIGHAGAGRATPPCAAPEAPAIGAVDYGLTGLFVAGAISTQLFLRPPARSPWRGGVLFDDDVRDALRLGSSTSRARAATASDVLELTVLAGMPLLDLAFAAGRGQGASGWRMLMIDLEILSATQLLVSLEKDLIGRERPYQRACASDDPDSGCGSPGSRRSFVSGHAALAFTAAGLVCVEHGELDLFGGGAGDTLMCVVATTLAGTTSVLRVVADKHYATDVLAGTAIGVFSGWVLPYLLHYRSGAASTTQVTPVLGGDAVGLSASGRF